MGEQEFLIHPSSSGSRHTPRTLGGPQEADLTHTIARELETSAKSALRDIDCMRDDWGLPIEYDGKRHGYYFTKKVERLIGRMPAEQAGRSKRRVSCGQNTRPGKSRTRRTRGLGLPGRTLMGKRVRQHLGLVHENRADPALVAGQVTTSLHTWGR